MSQHLAGLLEDIEELEEYVDVGMANWLLRVIKGKMDNLRRKAKLEELRRKFRDSGKK